MRLYFSEDMHLTICSDLVQRPEAFEPQALEVDVSPLAVEEEVELLKGWKVGDGALSLAEVHSSVNVPSVRSAWYSKAAAFAGLGGMIAVGYMDPGNW